MYSRKPFGDRLKELMAYYGISQKELGDRTGIIKSTLSQYVNNVRVPKQDVITRIADNFGIDEVWLMGYDVPMKPEITGAQIAKLAKDGNLWAITYQASLLDEKQQEVLLELMKQMVKDNG